MSYNYSNIKFILNGLFDEAQDITEQLRFARRVEAFGDKVSQVERDWGTAVEGEHLADDAGKLFDTSYLDKLNEAYDWDNDNHVPDDLIDPHGECLRIYRIPIFSGLLDLLSNWWNVPQNYPLLRAKDLIEAWKQPTKAYKKPGHVETPRVSTLDKRTDNLLIGMIPDSVDFARQLTGVDINDRDGIKAFLNNALNFGTREEYLNSFNK